MDITTLAKRRYTTKVYDASKKISDEQFKQLQALLRSCPSSVNSQPWHFIVAKSDEAKARILPAIAEFNRPRVKDASHVVIFCARTEFTEAHLQNLLKQEEKDGRFANEEGKQAQNNGRRYFVGLNNTSPEALLGWESKQIYIALSALMFGAASLGIDSTPIEGFDINIMNEILGLKEKGFTSVVIASLGYRSEQDFNAVLPKSRLPEDEIFTIL